MNPEPKLRRVICLMIIAQRALPPWSQSNGREMVAKVGPDLAVLRAPIDLTVDSDETSASFDVQAV